MASRPQEPTTPFPYLVEEVRIWTDHGQVCLAGTLTRPQAAGKSAAVLLIPGSGPQNRDERLCGHRPFLVLADHLTRSGIAVLRLDDRGVGGSTGNKDLCTHQDLLRDVRAALDFMAGHDALDPSRLGLVGHSEGAILAAAAAARQPDVSLIVLMACPSLPGEQSIHEQSARIARLAGASEAQIAHEHRMNDAVFRTLRQPLLPAMARDRITSVLAAHLSSWPDMPADDHVLLAENVNSMADIVLAPAFRAFLACDPALHLRSVRCPVLALFGGLDVQVNPASHMPALSEALGAAGNPDIAIEEWPGLNHLFQTAGTGAISEYEAIEETIAPSVLARISGWICAHV